jgi:hypothetical protein
MGEKLANKILSSFPNHDIDHVIPIPETSRTAALQCSLILKRPYREGFIKNRYIARTFIMPGQEARRKTVRLKLNTIRSEFEGKVVLLIDDSIVRGTTSVELVQMARDAGAKKVYFASAAPPVRYPNVYGIDIPTRQELIAFDKTEEEIGQAIGADLVIYNDIEDVIDAVRSLNPSHLSQFDDSCFSGNYITCDINEEYLSKLEGSRGKGRSNSPASLPDSGQLKSSPRKDLSQQPQQQQPHLTQFPREQHPQYHQKTLIPINLITPLEGKTTNPDNSLSMVDSAIVSSSDEIGKKSYREAFESKSEENNENDAVRINNGRNEDPFSQNNDSNENNGRFYLTKQQQAEKDDELDLSQHSKGSKCESIHNHS